MRSAARTPRLPLGRLLPLGLLLLGGACGDPEAPEGPPPAVRRAELRTSPLEVEPSRAPILLQRLDPDRIAALPRADGAIEVSGDAATIEGPRVVRLFDLAEERLDQVSVLALEARSERGAEVSLLLLPSRAEAGGASRRRMLDRRTLVPGERMRLEFELPGDRDKEGRLELAFHSTSGGVRAQLFAIEELALPPLHYLPAPGEEARIVQLGLETRMAVTMVAGSELELPGVPGESWRIAAGVPARLPGKEDPRLSVLQGESRLGARELSAPGGWYEFEVESGTDEPLRLRLSGPEGGACALATPMRLHRRPAPRTVVLVTTDTHRADHVGAARGVNIRTPAMDELAGRGIFFEDAGSVSNMTSPSHASILTGVHPRDTGVVDNASLLGDAAPTLQEAFSAAGFLTLGATSAWHLGPDNGFAQGFDQFTSPPPNGSEGVDALSWARAALERAEELDVFLWVHLFDPHAPYTPPPTALEEYWPSDRDPRSPEASPPLELRVPSWARDVRDEDYLRALYRAEVSSMDERLAGLFDVPRVRDGLVALTADHGETLGLGSEAWDHGQLGPDTQRVPLILSGAGLEREQGLRPRLPVSNSDVGRTLLDLCGLHGANYPGRNLLEQVRAEATGSTPRYGLSSYGSSATVELDGWYLRLQLRDPEKLAGGGRVSIHHGRGKQEHQVELFHLPTDPEGREDLAQAELERARRLRGLLVRFLAEARPEGWNSGLELDLERGRTLEGLGYAGSARDTSSNVWWEEGDCSCEWCTRFGE